MYISVNRQIRRFRLMGSSSALVIVGSLAAAVIPASAFAQTQPGSTDPTLPGASTTVGTQARGQAADGTTVPAPLTEPQEPAADGSQDIIVTGTSLRGIAPVGTQPTTIGVEDIRQIAPASTIDLLRTVPQISNLGADDTRTQGSQGASQNNLKSAGLNLRGLGPTATLMLVNGRRVQPGGTITAFYDPNIIPTSAISRVEVLLDGASSVYGSDAVGGVVNLITKRNYEGMDMGVRYGWADGYDQITGNFSGGKKWSTGSVSLAFEYQDRSALAATDTRFVTQDFRAFGGLDRRRTFSAPGTIVVGSTRYAIPANQNGRGLTASQLVAGTSNLYDATRENVDFLPKQTRYGGTFNLTQEVAPGIELSYDAFYSQRDFKVRQTGNGQGFNATTIVVPNTNPFFVSPVPGATSTRVEYEFNIERPTVTRGSAIDWGNSVGLSAGLFGDWALDAFASYSETRGTTGFNQFLNAVTLAQAVADPNPATAFNPFCDPRAFTCNSDAVFARFLGERNTRSKLGGWQYVAKVNGSLFDLPGGPAKLAVGVEYNDSTFKYFNEATNNSTNTLFTVKDLRLDRNVKSAFAELAAPIFDPLTLSAAVRIDDYSDFGTTTNPRFGATFEPVGWFAVRASYATSFRAPSLTERSDAGTNYFVENVNDPTVAGGSTRALYITGGNLNLQPETAKSWSVGADLKPSLIRGLRASVTYYNVKYNNLIRNLVGLQNVVLGNPALYGFAVTRNPNAALLNPYLTSPFLQTAGDDPANIKAFLNLTAANLGASRQDGIDFSAGYDVEVAGGTASAGLNGTKVLTQTTQNLPGQAFINTLDTFGNLVSFNMRGDLGWRNNRLGATLFMNHVGGYTNNAGVVGVPLDTKVKSWTTFDATLRYSFENGPGLLGGVSLIVNTRNLFDQDPPIAINNFLPFDSQNANIFGRIMSIELRKAF